MIKKFGFHLPELCSTFSYYYCKTQSVPESIENCFIFNTLSLFLCPSVSCSPWCFCVIVVLLLFQTKYEEAKKAIAAKGKPLQQKVSLPSTCHLPRGCAIFTLARVFARPDEIEGLLVVWLHKRSSLPSACHFPRVWKFSHALAYSLAPM